MATGRLGVADLAATTNTSLYTCPTDTYAVVNVSICNRSVSTVTIRMSVSASGTPADSEFIEYDQELLPSSVLERTGIVMDAGKILVVRSSGASVSAVVMGIETTTV